MSKSLYNRCEIHRTCSLLLVQLKHIVLANVIELNNADKKI